MNHDEVEERDVAERYVLRRLAREEVSLFEEHLLECAECVAAVEACEGLRGGLRSLAAEEASREPARERRGVAAWLGRMGSWQQAAVLAGMAAVLAAIPSGALVRQLDAARRERDAARVDKSEAEQRLAERVAAGEREREAPAPASPSMAVVAPVFVLPLTRSAEVSPSDVMRVRLRASDQWIVLALERAEITERPRYRVTLSTAEGRVVWQRDDVISTARDFVALSFHSRLFEAGDYVMSLEARGSNGRMYAVGRYPFRILLDR